ncbi:F-box protein PP2-B15-like [Beta vulgaris subsp. vulgaris]|uniref:F-box protein PP2-B15-like n=1 Tax=Beta vulgaris subsp. vulgaris TaxID=3555 RepID=UPI002036E7DC|nr:F-box protein PP2-B15-like [Beta vulgaris subsp. vulgaris]
MSNAQIFNLDRLSKLKSYVLLARELSIENVELRTTSWLEIHGYLKMKMLSPKTTYGAYLIFKVSERAYGLDIMPMEVSVEVDNDLVYHNTMYLRQDFGKKHHIQCDHNKVVKMSLMEIKGHHLKGGLIAEGIEIRPLH